MSCEIPEFYSEDQVTAAKERACDECGGLVFRGERYVSIRGKWEGQFVAFVQHQACRDFAAKLNLEYFGECAVPFGGVNEALADGIAAWELTAEDLARVREEWRKVSGIRGGTCSRCGCTEERACPGGCSWANVLRTVCTACKRRAA